MVLHRLTQKQVFLGIGRNHFAIVQLQLFADLRLWMFLGRFELHSQAGSMSVIAIYRQLTALARSTALFRAERNSIGHQQQPHLPALVAQNDVIIFFLHAQIAFENIQDLLVLFQLFRGTESI
jgi:hypothetical protein